MSHIPTQFYEFIYSQFKQLDESDLNVQKKYQYYLDKLIDTYLMLEYKKERKNNSVYTIDQVHMYFMSFFWEVRSQYREQQLQVLANKIAYLTRRKDEIPYYFKKVEELYESYQSLGNCNDAIFYNEILNKQQNFYLSKTRKEIIKELIDKLPLTEKTKQRLCNRIRLPIIIDRMKKGEYDSFCSTRKDLKDQLKKAHKSLSNKRNLKRVYSFSKEDYDFLDNCFLKGELSKDAVEERFSFFDKKQIKMITNAYNRILLPYLDNLPLDKEDITRINVSLNYKQLKIYSKEQLEKNLKDLENLLSPYEKEKILQEPSCKELVKLLPLVNESKIFKLDTFLKIALNLSKIKEHLLSKGDVVEEIDLKQILNRLPKVIELANAYDQSNDRTCAILGENLISKIIEDDATSCNPDDYLMIYLKMLNQPYSKIPPICGEFQKYIYESGNNNIDRLLIGKNSYRSCLGPSEAGEKAYEMSLSNVDADVLIIKKKDNSAFVGRTLLFRQGNFVILAPIMGSRGINKMLYDEKFLMQIGNQIIEKALSQQDNLDYVFLTTWGIPKKMNFFYLADTKLGRGLPHCDIEPLAYLIASKKSFKNPAKKDLSKKDIHLKLNVKEQALYFKERLQISRKEVDYIQDIQKIKALKMDASYSNEVLISEDEHYDEVYVGQDWYIAIKDKKIIETCIYKVDDPRQNTEITMVIDNLVEQGMMNISDDYDQNQKVRIKEYSNNNGCTLN